MKEKYQDLLKDPSEEIKMQQLDIIKGSWVRRHQAVNKVQVPLLLTIFKPW